MPLEGYLDDLEVESLEVRQSRPRLASSEKAVRDTYLSGGTGGSLTQNAINFGGRQFDRVGEALGLKTVKRLSADEANARYEIDGYLKFDKSISESEAAYRYKAKRDEVFRQDILSHNESIGGLEAFAYSFAGDMVDPVSAALNFVPVVGQVKWLAQAGRAGFKARVAFGLSAGFQGGLVQEAATFGVMADQGKDYTAADAARGVLASTVFGGGLAAGVGGVSHLYNRSMNKRASPRPVAAAQGAVADSIRAQAMVYGVDPEAAIAIARIESGLNPKAQNPNSSAGGVFQFIDSTWAAMGGGDRFDANRNIELGIKFIAQNQQGLRRVLGREPTSGELYLAHQQGLGGAIALLKNPERRAVDVLASLNEGGKPIGMSRAAKKIKDNNGDIDMTAGAFARMWSDKIDGVSGAGADMAPAVSVQATQDSYLPPRVPPSVRMLDEIDQVGTIAKAIDDLADNGRVDVGGLIEQARLRPRVSEDLDDMGAIGIPARGYHNDVAVTVRGREVKVKFALVEAKDLISSHDNDLVRHPDYPAELQPRDRPRAGSQARLLRMEREFNAKRLMTSSEAEGGAPIISPDGVIESGNGRVILLRRNSEKGNEIFDSYRKELSDQGFDISGMSQPILVRIRTEPMTGSERVSLSREMNADTSERMSIGEQAFVDRDALSDADIQLYRGGAVTQVQNDSFAKVFLNKAGAGQENDLIDPVTSRLSQAGIERMQAALVARAFGGRGLVHAIFETSNPLVKSLGNALADVAPIWAKMRAMSKAGEIAEGADTTSALIEAVAFVRHVRDKRLDMADVVEKWQDQPDMFAKDALSPEALEYLRLFYVDDKFKSQRRAAQIAEDLELLAQAIINYKGGVDLFGDVPRFDIHNQIDVLRQSAQKEGRLDADEFIESHRHEGDGGWLGLNRQAQSPDEKSGLISIERKGSGAETSRPGQSDSPVAQDLEGADDWINIYDDPEIKALAAEIDQLHGVAGGRSPEAFDDPKKLTQAIQAFGACLVKGGVV